MTLLPLYAVVENPVPTTLLSQYVVGESPSITVNSMSYIPEAPNHITIWGSDDEYFITLEYTSVVGNTLSGLSRLYGVTAGTFPAGSHAVCAISKYDFDAIKSQFDSTNANLAAHETDLDNPHSVTKAQVGLGNADNTSDLEKPISNLTQAALDNKTDVTDFNAHTTNKSNPHEVTKAQVGLGNVDNTSDSEKVNTSGNPIKVALATKVDKVSGSSLVPDTKVSAYDAHIVNKSNPHEVTKAQIGLPNVVDGAQINVIESISKNGAAQTIVNKNVNLVLSKGDVGLGNVDNTSDANKPVSTATQTELNKKVDKVAGSSLVPDTKITAYDSHLTNTSNPHSVTKSQVGLGNVDNTSDTAKADTAGNPVHDKIETKAPIAHASSATTYGIASASNYGHPKAASAAPSNATLAAAVGTDNGLYARADHSHAKETFTMNGVTINSREWVSDNTYSDYPYKATISNTSISASHIPIVILSSDDAISGNICTVANTAEGNVTIYARAALPCVISKIAFIKE